MVCVVGVWHGVSDLGTCHSGFLLPCCRHVYSSAAAKMCASLLAVRVPWVTSSLCLASCLVLTLDLLWIVFASSKSRCTDLLLKACDEYAQSFVAVDLRSFPRSERALHTERLTSRGWVELFQILGTRSGHLPPQNCSYNVFFEGFDRVR
eukprot:3624289-Amphidinium_carterae.2